MVAHPVTRGSGLRKIALDPHRGRLRESREPQKQAGAPPLRVGLGSGYARNRFSALRALIHVGAFNLWLVLRKKLGRAIESNCTEIATQFAPRRFTIQFASPLELLKIATSATGC